MIHRQLKQASTIEYENALRLLKSADKTARQHLWNRIGTRRTQLSRHRPKTNMLARLNKFTALEETNLETSQSKRVKHISTLPDLETFYMLKRITRCSTGRQSLPKLSSSQAMSASQLRRYCLRLQSEVERGIFMLKLNLGYLNDS